MSTLKQEIELNRDFHSDQEEALLALVWTHQCMIKASTGFFQQFDLTETHFNALMIIADYQHDGITQSELARRLLINRASSGSLVDTLENKGLLIRQPVPQDRRAYQLSLTPTGEKLLKKIKKPYYQLLQESMSVLSTKEIAQLTKTLNRFRTNFLSCLNDYRKGQTS